MTVLFILFVVLMIAYIRFLLWAGDRAAEKVSRPPIPSSAQLRHEWEDLNG